MQTSYWNRVRSERVRRRRLLGIIGAATLGGALQVACGGDSNPKGDQTTGLISSPADTTTQAKRGGIMKDRSFGDPPTLDPMTSSNPWNNVGPMVYSSLLAFKPGYLKPSSYEVIGDAAESWEYAADGLSFAMKLRPNIRWHSKAPIGGRLFDMDDVLFSWQRFATRSSARSGVANSVNPAAPVLSLTATDSRRVVVKLKEPISFAPRLFGGISSGDMLMIPKETDSQLDLRYEMIGTGPFVMTDYQPSVGFTLKRHPEYWDRDYALVDQVDLPIIPEYTATLAQLKAGHIYSFGSRGSGSANIRLEDVLPLKREQPNILVYQGELANPGGAISRLIFGWQSPPFFDERVRQAFSMSFDRDLFLDVFFNVTEFNKAGLEVETRWNTSLNAIFEGWWLDPTSKDFGTNGKYFQHNVSEAKKLLAAAGNTNGLTLDYGMISGTELGNSPKQAEVLTQMLSEAGIESKIRVLDYLKEYIPTYRDGRGQFEGYGFISGGGVGREDAIDVLSQYYWSRGGGTFHGFSANGKNDQLGDPQVDSLIERARVERDQEKQRMLAYDLQRYLAKSMYAIPLPGFGTGFTVAWPCLANFRVFPGARLNYRLWVDESKPPIAKA